MLLLIISLLLIAPIQAEASIERPHATGEFETLVIKAAKRLQKAAKARPYKLRSLNDSLAFTARAAKAMIETEHYDDIKNQLTRAKREYKENHFATFLQAVVHDSSGDESGANEYFAEFVIEGTTSTDFEEKFITWSDFHKLRRYAYNILNERGYSLDAKESELAARTPFHNLVEYISGEDREDHDWNAAFVIIIISGLFLLAGAFAIGISFTGFVMQSIVSLYLAVWLSYLLWITDLAVGLPFGVTRKMMVPIVMAGTVILICFAKGLAVVAKKKQPIETGYKLCPYCTSVIVELATECSECHRKLKF